MISAKYFLFCATNFFLAAIFLPIKKFIPSDNSWVTSFFLKKNQTLRNLLNFKLFPKVNYTNYAIIVRFVRFCSFWYQTFCLVHKK